MGYIPPLPPNWRIDSGLSHKTKYKRRFAFLPVLSLDNTIIWFDFYYKKYEIWGQDNSSHADFIENITEAEYIVRKLADNL